MCHSWAHVRKRWLKWLKWAGANHDSCHRLYGVSRARNFLDGARAHACHVCQYQHVCVHNCACAHTLVYQCQAHVRAQFGTVFDFNAAKCRSCLSSGSISRTCWLAYVVNVFVYSCVSFCKHVLPAHNFHICARAHACHVSQYQHVCVQAHAGVPNCACARALVHQCQTHSRHSMARCFALFTHVVLSIG